jgi:ribonuclease P protein component
MFAKRERLPRARFAQVARAPARASAAHFSLVASSAARGAAVVVGKSVAKRAVDRNRLKRRVFAALRARARPPAVIVYARKGAAALPYRAIAEELAAAIAKIA